MLNVPNILTLVRIFLIPILVVFYFLDMPNRETIITSVFALAAVTDWLDGYLARKMEVVSRFGEFLDPVADKLIVTSALILLVSDLDVLDRVIHTIPFAISVCIIVGRELVISALREWMSELGERGVVSVGALGKVKTGFQMVSIAMLLYAEPLYGLPIFLLGELAFYVAALLTLWSMWAYLNAAVPVLFESSTQGD